MNVITAIQEESSFTDAFKLISRKAGAFASKAYQSSYQYPGYMDIEDFQQEALVAVLEADRSFEEKYNVPEEAWAVLKMKERLQALRRLAHKTPTTVFETVMIDLLKPHELEVFFGNEQALQTPDVYETIENFLLVYDFAKTLKPKQLKVFRGMYLGYTQPEIAKDLGVKQNTISVQEKNIRAAFVAFCEKNKLQDWLDYGKK